MLLLWAPLRGFLEQRPPVVAVVPRHEELEGLGGRRWRGWDSRRRRRRRGRKLRTLASVVRPSGRWGRRSHCVYYTPNNSVIKRSEEEEGLSN